MNRPSHAAAAALSALCATASFDAPAGEDKCWQGLQLSIENDYFGRTRIHTDRWYTNGLQVAWSFKKSPECLGPGVNTARDFGNFVTPLGRQGVELPNVYFGLGQNIYTPQDITVAGPQPHDRPWAGYLYGVVGMSAPRSEGRHETFEIKTGLIGPASGASGVQRWFHEKVIHDDEPLGWPNQLRPRLAVQANYTFTQRWTDLKPLPEWAGVHGHVRLSLGRPRTLAAVGLTLVAGEKDRMFGAPDEGDHMGLDFTERPNRLPAWLDSFTFYAQAQVAAVAYNQFIEGTSYGPQTEVRPRRAVVMTTLGTSWRICRKVRFEYRIKWRSPDFEPATDAPTDRVQPYGEVRVVVDTSN